MMQTLVVFASFSIFNDVYCTNYKQWAKVTHVESNGFIHTTDFIEQFERNATTFIQMCCKDEKICANSSLSLGTEVHKWPIITKANISELMKEIKRSINYQVQLLSIENGCKDDNRSQSMLSQLQESLKSELETKITGQIESKCQDLKDEMDLLSNKNSKYELKIQNLETKIKHLQSNLESTTEDLKEEIELLNNKSELRTQNLDSTTQDLRQDMILMDKKSLELEMKIKELQFPYTDLPADCGAIPKDSKSGVYEISLDGKNMFKIYCEMEVDGGGWNVFQRRIDDSQDFNNGWYEYEEGFGHAEKNFWLGNSNLHAITSKGNYELRIDLEDYDGNKRFAKYSKFSIGDKSSNYKLAVEGYTADEYGDTGDSFSYHQGGSFSTKDKDNDDYSDGQCAEAHKGGWWFTKCLKSNLNGVYGNTGQQGIIWQTWKGYSYSMKSAKMMTRKKLD